jgi:hypothetical protein
MREDRLSDESSIKNVEGDLGELGREATSAHSETVSTLAEEKSKLRRQLDESRRAQEEMKVSLLELHQREKERLMGRLDTMEARWKAELEEKQKEGQDQEEAFAETQRRLQDEFAKLQEAAMRAGADKPSPQQEHDPRWQQLLQQQQLLDEREAKHREDLQKLRDELRKMKADTEERLKATMKARNAWFNKEFWDSAGKVVDVVGKGVVVATRGKLHIICVIVFIVQ